MGRIYTRKSRALANVFVFVLVWLVFMFANNQTTSTIVIVMLFVAPGIICYGYFLSSQVCVRCGNSIFDLSGTYVLWRIVALFAPLHVPFKCPHYGAATNW